MLPSAPAFAAGPGWYVEKSPAGTPIARLDLSGIAVRSIELACDGTRLAVAVLPQPGPALARYPLMVKGDAEPVIGIAVPRMGSMYMAYLSDTRIPDGILGKWRTAQIAGQGGQATALSNQNARAVFGQALAACYRMPAAAPPPAPVVASAPTRVAPGNAPRSAPTGTGIFADATLPAELRTDLFDFDSGCAGHEVEDPGRPGTMRRLDARPPVAKPDAIRRADFNGDGKDDYLLDSRKLRCSKAPESDQWGPIMVYVSQPDGSYRHGFDAVPSSYKVVPGKPAALFLHQDEDEDGTPLVNQTVRMTPDGGWPASDIGIADYRLWKPGRYPPEIVELFAGWARDCAARGLRLAESASNYNAYRTSGAVYDRSGTDKSSRTMDLNGDGKQDYVIDAREVSCGHFQHSATEYEEGAPLCGRGCSLIAVVSKPDGSYLVDRVPDAAGLDGNGDTTSLDNYKGRSIICYNQGNGDSWHYVRLSYAGTRRETVSLPRDTGCDGAKYQ